MRFFYDCEFLEDGETIVPISIAMVAEDGTGAFYSVFGNWLCDLDAIDRVREHDFLMANVVPHLPRAAVEIVSGRRHARVADPLRTFAAHPMIGPDWMVRQQLLAWISAYGDHRSQHELWAYYGAYDHVLLAQLWGPMIQLPEAIPMFTRELMQLEADVNARRMLNAGLDPVQRPAKADEHHALADARWNLTFYKALLAGDVPADSPLAWTFHDDRQLVTVPTRVFVAGHERLTSQGPNEGYDEGRKDEKLADRLWLQTLGLVS